MSDSPVAEPPAIPPPVPPGDADAWYASDVRQQYEVLPDVVVTLRTDGDGVRYDVREPPMSVADRAAAERVADYFADAHASPPVTREGTVERARAGLSEKHRRVVARLTDRSRAGRRRLGYAVLCEQRCLGALTPFALDERVEAADVDPDGRLVVHTRDFASARTSLTDPPHLGRFLAERLATYTVPFENFDVPVVVHRDHLLGGDAFDVRYAVQEPDLLPGDEVLVEDCKDRVWESTVEDVVADRAAFVREHAARYLARRLTARNTRAWASSARYRLRVALAEYDLTAPPVDRRYAGDRLDDLLYYVLRDFVGHGPLTIPVRDGALEDVEANRVGERVKVVPRHADVGDVGRVPTNLVFDDERAFVNLVTQLAAADGVELNSANPSAKVNLRPDEVPDGETIRCAVSLPVVSEDGPHVSIRKQAPDALTPVDLVHSGSMDVDLVTFLWLCYEHHGVALFSGPTGAGKTTLMNAHMPFVPFDDRPISIDEGSREVRLPHETGVSLTTRDHENPYKRVTMADLMTESNYLNPDIEVIAEINTPASFETFAELLNTG